MKNKKMFIILFILISVIVFAYISDLNTKNKIKRNKKVCVARIIDVSLSNKPVQLKVSYRILCLDDTNRLYVNMILSGINYNRAFTLQGKETLAVYDSLNSNATRILLLRSDFEKYDIIRPDSLNWLDSLE